VKTESFVPPLRSRLAVAASALLDLARDPSRLDRVFDLGVALNAARIPKVLATLEKDPDTKRLLDEQPSIDSQHVDFDALERLPDGTLGREYVRFLRDNGITPDVFKKPDVADARAAYIMQRIRQTHDLWHVLTGYTPDVRGEILLQAFTYAQLRAPSALAITILGVVRHGSPGIVRDARKAFRRGRATRRLATYRWEERWSTPLDDIRRELACPSMS
jgi:ubiquinone biosynthesis protein COQ4